MSDWTEVEREAVAAALRRHIESLEAVASGASEARKCDRCESTDTKPVIGSPYFKRLCDRCASSLGLITAWREP